MSSKDKEKKIFWRHSNQSEKDKRYCKEWKETNSYEKKLGRSVHSTIPTAFEIMNYCPTQLAVFSEKSHCFQPHCYYKMQINIHEKQLTTYFGIHGRQTSLFAIHWRISNCYLIASIRRTNAAMLHPCMSLNWPTTLKSNCWPVPTNVVWLLTCFLTPCTYFRMGTQQVQVWLSPSSEEGSG